MTTANAVLRRELEEARQRAGDAEQRAASAERKIAELNDLFGWAFRLNVKLAEKLERAKRQMEEVQGTLVHVDQDRNEYVSEHASESEMWSVRAKQASKVACDLMGVIFRMGGQEDPVVLAARESFCKWKEEWDDPDFDCS